MKKVVSMTLDENLIAVVKSYADTWHMSVSAAVSYMLSYYVEIERGVDDGEKITASKASI